MGTYSMLTGKSGLTRGRPRLASKAQPRPHLPHTASQVVCDVAVRGWTLHWQDLPLRPAVATDRPVALEPSGGGPPSYFDLQRAEARGRRRTLAEPPLCA
jgi:hypothetical protein